MGYWLYIAVFFRIFVHLKKSNLKQNALSPLNKTFFAHRSVFVVVVVNQNKTFFCVLMWIRDTRLIRTKLLTLIYTNYTNWTSELKENKRFSNIASIAIDLLCCECASIVQIILHSIRFRINNKTIKIVHQSSIYLRQKFSGDCGKY